MYDGTNGGGETDLSDYSYERALRLGLIRALSAMDKEEFKDEVQKQLGLAPGQDCDTICGAMSEEEFMRFIEQVKKALQNKRRKILEQQIYA